MTQDCRSVLYEAAAGSGKTTLLVKQSLSDPSKRVLFTTFTDENTEVIGNSLLRANGLHPQHIDLMPWFTFLLRHCVRPFLWHAGFCLDFDSGLILVNEQSARGTKKNSIEHYVSSDGRVYSDKLAELALRINGKTQGAVIDRLASIYDCLFIDEAQDLSGYDLELIEVMLRSGMNLTLAADQRQATYHTNNSAKNKKYRDLGLGAFLRDNKLTNLCIIDDQSLAGCHRCNQQILNLANALYPDLTAAKAAREENERDAELPPLHIVLDTDLERYIERWRPVVLRNGAQTRVPEGFQPQNFGASKGQTYDRVLIYPTAPIRKWLQDHSEDLKSQSRARLYVAITRARYSVGFVGTRSLADKAKIPLCDVSGF